MARTIKEEIVWTLAYGYALLPQIEKRQFGGSAPGKGRKPAVAAAIAAKLAGKINYAMSATDAAGPVSLGDLAQVIEKSLGKISPEDAFRTLERSVDQPEKARAALAEKLADDLLAAFGIRKKPFTGHGMISSMENGPCAPSTRET